MIIVTRRRIPRIPVTIDVITNKPQVNSAFRQLPAITGRKSENVLTFIIAIEYHHTVRKKPRNRLQTSISNQKGGIFISAIFEAVMVISFGLSWPLSIYKSYKSRTTKGKSLFFMLFILFGYACGIASKLTGGNLTYVFFFYILNFVMVAADLAIYYRNSRIMADMANKPENATVAVKEKKADVKPQ